MQTKPSVSVAMNLLLAGLFFSQLLQAQVDSKEDWTLNLYFENDLFAETDQNYTNGIRFSLVSPDLKDYVDDPNLYRWLRSINKRLTFFHGSPDKADQLQRNLVFSIGQTIYTPQNINHTDIDENDRPYAGWLYTSFAYHTKDQEQLDTLELQIGIVGPAAQGQEIQDFFHDLRDFEKFQGWDNQLENELGLLMLYEHKHKLLNNTYRNRQFGYDLITHLGGAIGNVGTYVNFGGEFRFGWLIPNDFGTSAVRPGGDNSAPDAIWDPRKLSDGRWGLHFFASFDARLVAHDIFLDGNTFEDSHSIDKKNMVGDLALGVSTVYKGVKISFARVFRSKEFKQQDDSHAYGSLSLSFNY